MKFGGMIVLSICSLLLGGCNSKDKGHTGLPLDTLVVQDPEAIQGNLKRSLFIGIDESNELFAYTGGSQEYRKIAFSELDTLVARHRETLPDAAFVIKGCEGVKSGEIKKLIERLKLLGVERFTLDNSKPCRPLNGSSH
jgi:hypothetical protein